MNIKKEGDMSEMSEREAAIAFFKAHSEWLADSWSRSPEGREYQAKFDSHVAALAAPEQGGVEFPELPKPAGVVGREGDGYSQDRLSSEGAYDADQMHTYAGECVRAATTECSQHWQTKLDAAVAHALKGRGAEAAQWVSRAEREPIEGQMIVARWTAKGSMIAGPANLSATFDEWFPLPDTVALARKAGA